MSGPLQIKKGTAGSRFNYDEFSYPAVPYGPNDFNRIEKRNRFKPFIYQEVIDTGHNEPITHWEYIPMGRVIEFLYGAKLETCPGKDQTSSSSTLETLARVGASFRVETLSLSWTTMITSGVTELAARIY
ncbi:hypothetical protein MRX96_017859 [Rhipicephalus microplus]